VLLYISGEIICLSAAVSSSAWRGSGVAVRPLQERAARAQRATPAQPACPASTTHRVHRAACVLAREARASATTARPVWISRRQVRCAGSVERRRWAPAAREARSAHAAESAWRQPQGPIPPVNKLVYRPRQSSAQRARPALPRPAAAASAETERSSGGAKSSERAPSPPPLLGSPPTKAGKNC